MDNLSNANKYRLTVDQLKKTCSIEKELKFCSTSKDGSVLDGVIGQDRAVRSMEFGLSMRAPF